MTTTTKRKKASSSPYISFDFDNTLYNPESDSVIKEIKNIMDEYVDDGYNVCITTLRGDNETARIKDLFPEIEIFATNGFNKALALKKYIPVPIVKHYDDDLNICVALKTWTKIKPIWVRTNRLRKEINKMETIDLK